MIISAVLIRLWHLVMLTLKLEKQAKYKQKSESIGFLQLSAFNWQSDGPLGFIYMYTWTTYTTDMMYWETGHVKII